MNDIQLPKYNNEIIKFLRVLKNPEIPCVVFVKYLYEDNTISAVCYTFIKQNIDNNLITCIETKGNQFISSKTLAYKNKKDIKVIANMLRDIAKNNFVSMIDMSIAEELMSIEEIFNELYTENSNIFSTLDNTEKNDFLYGLFYITLIKYDIPIPSMTVLDKFKNTLLLLSKYCMFCYQDYSRNSKEILISEDNIDTILMEMIKHSTYITNVMPK